MAITAIASIAPLTTPEIPLLKQTVDVTSVAIAGAASNGSAAVGGSVIVDVFALETHATVGDRAQINQAGPATAGQSITVSATDTTTLVNAAGGLGGATGTAGIGVAIDVQVVTKHVTAAIGASAAAPRRRRHQRHRHVERVAARRRRLRRPGRRAARASPARSWSSS